MIQSEMLDRMTWHEFNMWAIVLTLDSKQDSPANGHAREQTPEQQLQMLDAIGRRKVRGHA